MVLLWGEQEFVNQAAIATSGSPPDETPVGLWDTWDFRGLWNQPLIATEAYPPSTPVRYPHPWQVYPR